MSDRGDGSAPAGAAQINACPAVTAGRPEPTTGVTPGYLQLTRAVEQRRRQRAVQPTHPGVAPVCRWSSASTSTAAPVPTASASSSSTARRTSRRPGPTAAASGTPRRTAANSASRVATSVSGSTPTATTTTTASTAAPGCPVGQRSPTTNSGPIAPNVVTVRGPGAGLTGYCYLAATVPTPITNPNQPGTTLTLPLRAATLAASEREVNVRVTPDLPGSPARIIVEIRYSPNTPGDPWVQLLDIPAPAGLPSTYKFGLSSSTGGSTDVHLVRGVEVRTIEPLERAAAREAGRPHRRRPARRHHGRNHDSVPVHGHQRRLRSRCRTSRSTTTASRRGRSPATARH